MIGGITAVVVTATSLVEAMGGRMWAVRPPDGGSEFGFSLRVLEVDEEELAEVDARRPVLPVQPYRGRSV
jgi:hypothetical protein